MIDYIRKFIGDRGIINTQVELVNTTGKGKNLTFWYDCAIHFKNNNKVIIEFNGSCWHAVNPYQNWISKKGQRTADVSYSNDFIKRIVAEEAGYSVFYFWDNTNTRKQLKMLLKNLM